MLRGGGEGRRAPDTPVTGARGRARRQACHSQSRPGEADPSGALSPALIIYHLPPHAQNNECRGYRRHREDQRRCAYICWALSGLGSGSRLESALLPGVLHRKVVGVFFFSQIASQIMLIKMASKQLSCLLLFVFKACVTGLDEKSLMS